MTLDRKDIKAIRRMIRYEFKQALVRTITIEKGVKPGTDNKRPGEKSSTPPNPNVKEEVVLDKVNILDWMVYYFPWVEGAHRGLQEDTNKTNNKTTKHIENMQTPIANLEAMKNIFLAHENTMKKLVGFTKYIEDELKGIEASKKVEVIELKKVGGSEEK